MENLLESIRAALVPEATSETRAAAIEACRAILGALGATPGEPLAAPRQPDIGPTAHAIASVIRSTPPDQLLDMLVAKLRAAVPADAQVPTTHKLNIPMIRIPTP